MATIDSGYFIASIEDTVSRMSALSLSSTIFTSCSSSNHSMRSRSLSAVRPSGLP